MTADFNREAGPLVRRNRELASSYLMMYPEMENADVFKINTDKNTVGNGMGMLDSQQLTLFAEAFPVFVDPEADIVVYPKLVAQVTAFWKKHNMVPSVVSVLEANAQ